MYCYGRTTQVLAQKAEKILAFELEREGFSIKVSKPYYDVFSPEDLEQAVLTYEFSDRTDPQTGDYVMKVRFIELDPLLRSWIPNVFYKAMSRYATESDQDLRFTPDQIPDALRALPLVLKKIAPNLAKRLRGGGIFKKIFKASYDRRSCL